MRFVSAFKATPEQAAQTMKIKSRCGLLGWAILLGLLLFTAAVDARLINELNPPVTAGADQLKLEFAYDSQGRRFSKTVSTWNGSTGNWETDENSVFVWDGWNLLYELTDITDGSAAEKAYVWGRDLSGTMQGAGGVGGLLMVTHAGEATYFPGFDGNGNVVEYVDAETGASVAQYAYSAFGETLRATGERADEFTHRFSTKPFDLETGLVAFELRYFDPATGRWLSRDGIGESGGANLYAFIGNDPLNAIDLLGYYKVGFLEFDESKSFLRNFGDYLGTYGSGVGQGGVNIAYGFRGAAEGVGETAAVIFDKSTRNLVIADVKTVADALRNDPCLAEELAKQLYNDAADTLTDPDKLAEAVANASAGGALATLTGSGGANALNKLLKRLPSNKSLKLPSSDFSLSGTRTLGYTTPDGKVFLQPGLSRADQLTTLKHESVHAFFSPRGSGPISTFRQNLGQFGYDNSQLLRFTEEAIAETYGSGSLLQGLRHPFNGGYGISAGGLATESAIFGGTLFGAGSLGYQLGGGE